MTSQPDKFFRDKLENFQKPAPAASWERIEAGIDKRNNKSLWLKIAASITIISVATFLIWPVKNSTDSVASNTIPVQKETEKVNPPTLNSSFEKSETPGPLDTKRDEKNLNKEKKINKKEKANEPVLVAELNKVQKVENIKIENPEPITTTENVIAQTTESEMVEPKTKPSRTIIYTAEEVNTRFMKKESIAQATSDEKKTSGIQKLVSLAFDLKNSDSGLGDLRQKKDEILALNFLDNKQKQN